MEVEQPTVPEMKEPASEPKTLHSRSASRSPKRRRSRSGSRSRRSRHRRSRSRSRERRHSPKSRSQERRERDEQRERERERKQRGLLNIKPETLSDYQYPDTLRDTIRIWSSDDTNNSEEP